MTAAAQDPHPPLWRFIPLHEFKAPSEPPAEAFRLNLRAFWHRLRRQTGEGMFTSVQPPEIRNAPPSVLNWLVPTPDWTEAMAGALDTALPDLPPASGYGLCPVVLAPPHSGVQNALRHWAERREYRLMGAPSPQQILHDPESWIKAWPVDDKAVVVLPDLEGCFLRHARGLEIVRWLIDHIWTTRQPCVLGCDSWAWAYLIYAARANLIQPDPLTLAPLTAADLERWIAASVYGRGLNAITFRRADNGRTAIRRPDRMNDPDFSDEYLVHLAAYSRGNPGVAWDTWRRSLAVAVDDDVKAEAQEEAKHDVGRTIWVRPWEKVHHPEVHAPQRDATYFVLHTILVHNGATTGQIDELLDLARLEIDQQIQELHLANLLERCGDCWHTVAGAYPAIRSLLNQEGFLTDDL